jgi:hypothetical protein
MAAEQRGVGVIIRNAPPLVLIDPTAPVDKTVRVSKDARVHHEEDGSISMDKASKTTVRCVRKKGPPPKRVSDDDRASIIKYADAGAAELAAIFGFTTNTIRKILREAK